MDNYYLNCPPKMSDQGRMLGDYKSPTWTNEYIRHVNGIYRDDQYRLFLQTNGKEMLDNEWDYYTRNASCWNSPCVHKYPTRVTNYDFAHEMQVYNSIFDMNTNEEFAPERVCHKYKDFRMMSDSI